jgi:transposase
MIAALIAPIEVPTTQSGWRFASDSALIKCLWHDGQGQCLFTKRLERGRFPWPSLADGIVTISTAQLGYLLSGIDWRTPQYTWWPQTAG